MVLEFNGGPITSDAGAVLPREANRRLRLTERAAAGVRDPRSQDRIEHEQETVLVQRILGIACGWEDLNDHQRLRHDPLWPIATGHRRGRLDKARRGLKWWREKGG